MSSPTPARVKIPAAVTAVVVLVTLVVSFVSLTAGAASAAATAEGGRFVPVQGRLLDTRSGSSVGGYASPMPNSWRSVQVAGVAGLPTTGIAAVQVNLTALRPQVSGSVVAAADGAPAAQVTSYLNYTVNLDESNMATIPVASNGKIMLKATGATNMIVDVQGYYTSGATAAGGYDPITPARFTDTRSGLGAPKARLTASAPTTFRLGGVAGVPNGATAAIVNFAVVNPDATGFFRVWAGDATAPAQSTTNFSNASAVDSASVIVPLATSGTSIGTFKVQPSVGLDLVGDVVGYFTPGGTGGGFVPLQARAYDSRTSGNGSLAANATSVIKIQGVSDIPFGGASSAALHVAVVPTASGGLINMWANGTPQPSTTVLNYGTPSTSGTVANLAVVKLGYDGNVLIKNSGSSPINVVVDIEGYYTPLVATPASEEIVTAEEPVADAIVTGMDRTGTPAAQAEIDRAASEGMDTTTEPLSVYISNTSTLVVPTDMPVHAAAGENAEGEEVVNFVLEMVAPEDNSTTGFAVPPKNRWKFLRGGFYKQTPGDWVRGISYNIVKSNNYRTCDTCEHYDYYRATRQVRGGIEDGSGGHGYSRLYDKVILNTPKARVDDFELSTPINPINGSESRSVSFGYTAGVEISLGVPPVNVSGGYQETYTATVPQALETVYPFITSRVGSGGSQWCRRDDADIKSSRTVVNRVSYITLPDGAPTNWSVETGMSKFATRCPEQN